ncbi:MULTISPECIES: hypothetical protein [Aeromonas]|uniref:hypothetical protein n=1 Tax=Aeromonas TaxID=642 RepID=UPI00211D1D45|nr:hypothetical protein [Aeromonas veronii]UUM70723.1 hypothetical protein NQU90_09820 [Aeromonas veronii]
MTEHPTNNQTMLTVEHARSSNYQVHVASGVTVNPMDGRIEMSFFADRVRYNREGLVTDEHNPSVMRANGQIEASPLREHVTGVSMSIESLMGLRDMLNSLIEDISMQQRPNP